MSTLLKPIITEKSIMAASRGVYTFAVKLRATKHEIQEAVNSLFKVNVVKVTTSRVHTPSVRTGRRRLESSRTDRRFARVTLKKGEKIALFDLKEEN